MRVEKKLNNNFAICIDGQGQELIAYGKGIGFPKTPYELTDLNMIDRTFYNINSKHTIMFSELPETVLQFTAKLMDIAGNELQYELNPNLVLTLADHIQFCIQRAKKNIFVQMPLIYEIEQMYPQEAKLGKYVVKQLERRFAIRLHPNEASGIAMSFVNARYNAKSEQDLGMVQQLQYEDILEETIGIVESEMGIVIDRSAFNFARYSTHLLYLLQRLEGNRSICSEISSMYATLQGEWPRIANCVELIALYFQEKWTCSLGEEEKVYLLLHINRICIREGL